MRKDLPKYKITIDEEYAENGESLGIEMIAFTSKPAILTKGMAFSNTEFKSMFYSDELKYRIAGPVMIPMEIYRCDSNEEYFVQFSADEIEKIHSKFMSTYSNKDVFNLEHNAGDKVPAYVLEAILCDSQNKVDMIKQEYKIDVPLGTSFFVTQITDKQYYKELVDKGIVGYSIEGFLGLKLSEVKPPYHDNCKCVDVDGNIISEAGVCDYCLEQQSKFEIDKKNNKQIMKEDKIPAGEYQTPDGKVLVVAEDGTFTVKEVTKEEMACGPKEEEMGLEVDETVELEAKVEETVEEAKIKETELAEGDLPVETPTEVVSYTKEEVDAKFDELYKLIGDLKAEEVIEDETETEVPVETKLSVNERVEL